MGRALRNMLNGLINSPASRIVGAGESYAERTMAGTLSRREEKVYTKLPHLILARRRCLQYHARQVWADGRTLNWPELRAPTNLSAIIIPRNSLLQVMRLYQTYQDVSPLLPFVRFQRTTAEPILNALQRQKTNVNCKDKRCRKSYSADEKIRRIAPSSSTSFRDRCTRSPTFQRRQNYI